MSMRSALVASAVAVACAAGPAAAQWSGFYFFGDSLTDAGSYKPVLPAGTGHFTTNPDLVWAQVLGARYGFDIQPANRAARAGSSPHAVSPSAAISRAPG